MGNRQGSRKAGTPEKSSHPSAQPLKVSLTEVAEVPVSGGIPRFEIPDWRERHQALAGITARGSEPGRGFDLGLWSDAPVGQVMSRWLAFRRELSAFHAVALGNQIHGTELMRLDSGRGWIFLDGVDGWITTTPGILVTVTVADCIPVYLVVPGRGVALLHAGWRGTAGGILPRGLEGLLSATRAAVREVVMHCGVGICGDCYEVGSEVLQGCGVPAPGPGPWHLDLRQHLAAQAGALGIGQITGSSWCSAHHRSSFYSHRASRGMDGRMVAYLGLLPA